jgi:branched-subunit amino acid ABC-type transport system permease component
LIFYAFRASRNLPPLNEVYRKESYVFFTDPVHALYYNLRYWGTHLPGSLIETDLIALFLTLGLAAGMLRYPPHRRLPMVVYTWGYALIFVSKVNWLYGTDRVTFTQSFALRASLFPW